MKKAKLFAGILVFGSLWGFAECIIGSALRTMDLPAGAIMTGIFAFGLMLLSRLLFKTKGMQLPHLFGHRHHGGRIGLRTDVDGAFNR